jgi:hypothetical protein
VSPLYSSIFHAQPIRFSKVIVLRIARMYTGRGRSPHVLYLVGVGSLVSRSPMTRPADLREAASEIGHL